MTAAQSGSFAIGAGSSATAWRAAGERGCRARRGRRRGDAPQPRRGGGDSVGHPVQATVSGMERAARPRRPDRRRAGRGARCCARILPRLGRGDAALLGAGRRRGRARRARRARSSSRPTLLVHGPDFRLAWSTPFDLGWKAAATNLADVAAMGARPTALVVALAAPPDDAGRRCSRASPTGCATACDALAPGLRRRGRRPVGVDDAHDRGDRVRRPRGPGARAALRRARRATSWRVAGARGDAARGPRAAVRRGARMPRASPTPTARADAARAASAARRRPARARAAGRPPASWPRVAGATAMLDVSRRARPRRAPDRRGERRRPRPRRVGARPRPARRARRRRGPRPARDVPRRRRRCPRAFEVDRPRRARRRGAMLVDGRPYAGADGWDPYRGWDGARLIGLERRRPTTAWSRRSRVAARARCRSGQRGSGERELRSTTTAASGESSGASSAEVVRELGLAEVVRRIDEDEVERARRAVRGRTRRRATDDPDAGLRARAARRARDRVGVAAAHVGRRLGLLDEHDLGRAAARPPRGRARRIRRRGRAPRRRRSRRGPRAPRRSPRAPGRSWAACRSAARRG